MRPQIYLVLIKDGRLALSVGAALEDRLLRDGNRAMALVPAVRGPEFADSDAQRVLAPSRSGQGLGSHGPQVVALYEDGLLASLASLGLPAYVGVQDGDEPRISRWTDDCGAIMLPVGTARDLVDAVADHTPWSRYAAGLPPARYPATETAPTVLRARQSGHDGPPARSRKMVTVASVAAGPLLLASLPPIAIAAGSASQVPALAAAASGASASVLTADTQPTAPPAAAPPAAAPAPAAPAPAAPASTGTPNTWSNYFSNVGTSIQNYANATVTGAGNLLNQVGTGFNNAMTAYGQAQINEAQAYQALANRIVQNNAAADQAGTDWGTWAARPGAAVGGATLATIAGLSATETGPGALVAAATAYPYGSKLGATAGLGLGYVGGYIGYQLSHLTDSPPSTTTSTPVTTTGGGNSFINAIIAADQTGQAWAGSLTGADKLAGEGLGYTLYNLLGNVGSNQGASANPNANQLELFPPGTNLGQAPAQPSVGPNWGQQTVGNVKTFTGHWGNGAATTVGLEYTAGFVKSLVGSMFAPSSQQTGSNVVVGPDGSVTTIGADGTVTVTGADGTLTVTGADGSVTVTGADGTVTKTAADGTVTKTAPDGTVTTTPPAGAASAAPDSNDSGNGTTTAATQPPAAPEANGTPQVTAGAGGNDSGNGTTTAATQPPVAAAPVVSDSGAGTTAVAAAPAAPAPAAPAPVVSDSGAGTTAVAGAPAAPAPIAAAPVVSDSGAGTTTMVASAGGVTAIGGGSGGGGATG